MSAAQNTGTLLEGLSETPRICRKCGAQWMGRGPELPPACPNCGAAKDRLGYLGSWMKREKVKAAPAIQRKPRELGGYWIVRDS
ncbi:MAG: hypothetical protein FJW32_20765 [Acidobacteria bacterium]|nr:hypothetical protein [Acidobacteriota bacterium]